MSDTPPHACLPDAKYDRWLADHDLLTGIKTTLDNLTQMLSGAGIPGKCATQDQRIIALEARVKVLETRFWWLISLLAGGVVLGLIDLLLRHGKVAP